MRWVFAFGLLLSLVAVLATADPINDEIYFFLDNSKPCVKLLHKTGSIGCASKSLQNRNLHRDVV
jgi:hypothetical protein